MAHSVLLMNHK